MMDETKVVALPTALQREAEGLADLVEGLAEEVEAGEIKMLVGVVLDHDGGLTLMFHGEPTPEKALQMAGMFTLGARWATMIAAGEAETEDA